jgi:hypothetical protein
MAFTLNPATVLGPEFYGFLLPWIFTFAIVYGLLGVINIFGGKKNINTALAFVIAFFVTGAAGPQMAAFFINLFGGAATYLAGFLVILLFAAMIGYTPTDFKTVWYLAAVLIIGIALFLGSTGALVGSIVIGSDIAALAFWLVIIIVAVYMIVGKDGAAAGGSSKKPGE